jgi:hypothetical protein
MDWREGMDPWVEHVKKNPKCNHLRLSRGPEFIKTVQIEEKRRELLYKLNKGEPSPNNAEENAPVADEAIEVDNTEGLI